MDTSIASIADRQRVMCNELAKAIQSAIEKFQTDSGLVVEAIQVDRTIDLDHRILPIVRVEVRL